MVRIPEQSGQYLASLVVLGGWGWAWGGGVFWLLLWDPWAGVNGRVLSPLVLEAVWNGWEDRENMAGIDMVLKTVTQSL